MYEGDSIWSRKGATMSDKSARTEFGLTQQEIVTANWGVSDRPGKPALGGCWVWGYDEISWFAHQNEPYRNGWLRYAWDWVREHDSNGFFQMPGSRVLHAPVDRQSWYYANTRSEAVPSGFSQEETIKAIWSEK